MAGGSLVQGQGLGLGNSVFGFTSHRLAAILCAKKATLEVDGIKVGLAKTHWRTGPIMIAIYYLFMSNSHHSDCDPDRDHNPSMMAIFYALFVCYYIIYGVGYLVAT